MRQRGFTLIELLIALSLMAVLALLSWRGVDTLMRTRESTQAQIQRIAAVQTTLDQWRADLDAVQGIPGLQDSGLLWNGQVLRLVRRSAWAASDGSDSGFVVVGWTAREGHWWRWQSAPLTRRADLLRAWQQAERWAQNPSNDDLALQIRLLPLESWQLTYFRGNAWTNPLSSGDAAPSTSPSTIPPTVPSASATPPDAVRLQLDLPAHSGLNGRITLDWVRPNFSNTKS
jgi:general secretion pathway protein J